jgi:hypothetical protein
MCMKMAAFWDNAPYSVVLNDHCSTGAYKLHHQGDEFMIGL